MVVGEEQGVYKAEKHTFFHVAKWAKVWGNKGFLTHTYSQKSPLSLDLDCPEKGVLFTHS
jgi:hypothetical protein